jgi:diguanylate cyclase (GGDEF)-like protein
MDKKQSLLIVDDEESLLDMLSRSLVNSGYACETFTSGMAVLDRLRSSPADILITDIAMPGLAGLDLTREAKRIRPDTMVIIMTGFIDDFSYDQAMEAGASDFIKKPFTLQELLMRLKQVKMQERLRAISITDELTGLLNRRGFFALAEQQMKVVSRAKRDLALLFADVDGFKAINDTFGHQEGDKALAGIADLFRQTFRESDIIARMSGDEFAILLIDTPLQNVSLIIGRLEQNIDAFNRSGGAPYRLSISIGMVVHDHDRPRTIDDLLKEADALMYAEKQRKSRERGLNIQGPEEGRGE